MVGTPVAAQTGVLGVVTPCPSAPSSIRPRPITITEQYQPVSTCIPTSRCRNGNCTTDYPFSTYDWISTVIPCFNSNRNASGSCTITRTDQPVTVSHMRATLTSYVTTSTAVVSARDNLPRQPYGGFIKERDTQPYRNVTTPVLDIVETNDIVRFSDIGPLAIPGYAGSGLCRSCDTDGKGAQSQHVKVEQCRNG
ncbi:hypothetical protein BJ546DRAFT_835955, partial [Cryomyces antarcticus]